MDPQQPSKPLQHHYMQKINGTKCAIWILESVQLENLPSRQFQVSLIRFLLKNESYLNLLHRTEKTWLYVSNLFIVQSNVLKKNYFHYLAISSSSRYEKYNYRKKRLGLYESRSKYYIFNVGLQTPQLDFPYAIQH